MHSVFDSLNRFVFHCLFYWKICSSAYTTIYLLIDELVTLQCSGTVCWATRPAIPAVVKVPPPLLRFEPPCNSMSLQLNL